MVEIQELPDSLRDPESVNFDDIPQLKYVTKMAKLLCPEAGMLTINTRHFFQGGTVIFLKRYFEGSIDTSFKAVYQNHNDLQATLGAYSIDPTAFWYLVLFLKDYVDDESSGMKQQNTAFTEIYKLYSKLHDMGFSINPFNGEYNGCEKDGKIQVRIGKGHWVEISSDKALYGIYLALESFLRKVQCERKREKVFIDGVLKETNCLEYDAFIGFLYNLEREGESESISIPETYKISYFAKYMQEFFKLFKFKSLDSNSRISKDKLLLASRVIYIIGYSNNENYNKRKKEDRITDMDFLKHNYKKEWFSDEIRREIYI